MPHVKGLFILNDSEEALKNVARLDRPQMEQNCCGGT